MIEYNQKEEREENKMKIGFCSLLTIVFIVLKLCGIIAWPWVWVLAPLWITVLVGIVAIVIITIVALIVDKF